MLTSCLIVEGERLRCGAAGDRAADLSTSLLIVSSDQKEKRYTEPVALSSTAPAGFPTGPCGLPRTTLGSDFNLLALRTRCTREPTATG